MEHKLCQTCGVKFFKKVTDSPYPSVVAQYEDRWAIRRFCTSKCARVDAVKQSWVKNRDKRIEGIKDAFKGERGAVIRKKMSEWQSGKDAPWWKDNDASYNSKHRWIQKHWKRTGVCQQCKQSPPPRKNGHSGTEWANISGRYDRNDRKDWLELCSKCHKFFDKVKRIARNQ